MFLLHLFNVSCLFAFAYRGESGGVTARALAAASWPLSSRSHSKAGKGEGGCPSLFWSAKVTRLAGGVPDRTGGVALVRSFTGTGGLSACRRTSRASRRFCNLLALALVLLSTLAAALAFAFATRPGDLDVPCAGEASAARSALLLRCRLGVWDLLLSPGGGVRVRLASRAALTPSP